MRGPGEFTDLDRAAMARAIALAERGLETTQPNPRVGCVLTDGHQIVGEGWHERAGEPHAEINALNAAGSWAEGATAYVTLEPCSHHGRTPPCVEALIAARVAKVIFALEDPNPLVSGRGAEALRRAGVVVDSGLLAAEAADLNPGFLKRMRSGRPWVRVKLAMSLDGRTALANGASQWITGAEARTDVHHWRARSSAIMTGIGTVLADDPRLDVRLPEPPTGKARLQPLRVVLDTRLRMPPSARMLAIGGNVLIMTTASQDDGKAGFVARGAQLIAKGAEIEEVAASAAGEGVRVESAGAESVRPESARAESARPESARPESGRAESGGSEGAGRIRLSLTDVLDRLGRREINELWVESGPRLAGALLQQALVDELIVYVAPKLLGPQARPLIEMGELRSLQDAPHFTVVDSRQIGHDIRLRLRPLTNGAN